MIISKALSRSMGVSYLPAMRLCLMMSRRWPSVMAPIWLSVNNIFARSTMLGAPFASRNETRASPVSRFKMASSVLNSGFARKVSAAVFTAF